EFKVGNIVFSELKRSDKIIVFTCTAGKPLCDYAKAEYQTDVLKGFLIESLANVVVETAMDRIQNQLRETYQTQNLMVSNRFSPGYCSWNVAEQHKLFELLPKNFCGVTLTESALMLPIKSISGFIGVGKNISFNRYKCRFCTLKQCIYKNKSTKI
ncbi:MAG: vitamin B12 dependent-methionine synthase activation domain-containing protein, partial [Bacteroidota bacterium]|nr:vitamin B12 dependent-methionine synthase activation domain-containing protein [Bacteroidota bacterium]